MTTCTFLLNFLCTRNRPLDGFSWQSKTGTTEPANVQMKLSSQIRNSKLYWASLFGFGTHLYLYQIEWSLSFTERENGKVQKKWKIQWYKFLIYFLRIYQSGFLYKVCIAIYIEIQFVEKRAEEDLVEREKPVLNFGQFY
jgi:hypothetical protein